MDNSGKNIHENIVVFLLRDTVWIGCIILSVPKFTLYPIKD